MTVIVYTKEQIRRLLKIDFIRFCIVGGTGFIINLIILTFLHRYISMPIFFAQLIAAEIALFSNFMLHHNWTYKSHKVKKTIPSLLLQFHATSWPAILGSAIMVSFFEKALNFNELFSLITSSLIALMWNFGWSKYVVWSKVTEKDIQEIVK